LRTSALRASEMLMSFFDPVVALGGRLGHRQCDEFSADFSNRRL
jgi:hypothetical protein